MSIAVPFLLVFAGWAVAVYGLRIRDGTAAVAFAATFGAALLILCVNALGYFLPIRDAFLASLGLVTMCGVGCAAAGLRRTHSLVWPSKKILLALAVITLVVGCAYMRDRGSDEWSWPHFALPATIIAGNFPIVEPANPWALISYHYGAPLLVAALSGLTGMSLAIAQALIPLLSAIGILWFFIALGKKLSGSQSAGLLAACMGLGGAGFFWLRGVLLVRDVFDRYVLGVSGGNAFWWLTPTIRNLPAQGLLPMLGHRPAALGGAFFCGFLFAFHQLLEEKNVSRRWLWLAVAVVFATQLALTLETSFVLLPMITIVWLGVGMLASGKDRKHLIKFLWPTAILWIAAGAIAILQGGALTMHGTGASFAWNHALSLPLDSQLKEGIMLGSLVFWRDFGPHAVLLLMTTIWCWKKKGASSFHVFLCLLAAAHLLIPFVVTYVPSPINIQRFVWIGFSLSSFMIALFLWETALRSGATRMKRTLAILAIGGMLLAATLNASIRLLLPTLRLESAPLLPPLPSRDAGETAMDAWVTANTTLADWFYMEQKEDQPDALLRDQTMKDRMAFSAMTGRYAVGWGNMEAPAEPWKTWLREIETSCNADAARKTGIRYLAILRDDQQQWFTKTCTATQWDLRFGTAKQLPLIYELRGR